MADDGGEEEADGSRGAMPFELVGALVAVPDASVPDAYLVQMLDVGDDISWETPVPPFVETPDRVPQGSIFSIWPLGQSGVSPAGWFLYLVPGLSNANSVFGAHPLAPTDLRAGTGRLGDEFSQSVTADVRRWLQTSDDDFFPISGTGGIVGTPGLECWCDKPPA